MIINNYNHFVINCYYFNNLKQLYNSKVQFFRQNIRVTENMLRNEFVFLKRFTDLVMTIFS